MTPSFVRMLVAAVLGAGALAASAQPQSAPSRGELLYSIHCVYCHNTQVHWRERKQAHDWQSLIEQVRLWQATAKLGWDDAEVESVARYLNETVYHFAAPNGNVGLK